MAIRIKDDGTVETISFYTQVTVKRLGKIDKIYECLKHVKDDEQEPKRKKGEANQNKLENNIIRAKNKIKEYALCNTWTYFCTLTLSSENGDRYDLKSFQSKLSKWINNYNYRYQCNIKYVLVPEYHDDGAIHFHGLLEDIPIEHLSINKYGYLDWEKYKSTFGFISISVIRDNVLVANYITKYVTKDMAVRSADLNQHLYICSKGLKKAVIVYQSAGELTFYDYENEFCKIKEIDNSKDDYDYYIID